MGPGLTKGGATWAAALGDKSGAGAGSPLDSHSALVMSRPLPSKPPLPQLAAAVLEVPPASAQGRRRGLVGMIGNDQRCAAAVGIAGLKQRHRAAGIQRHGHRQRLALLHLAHRQLDSVVWRTPVVGAVDKVRKWPRFRRKRSACGRRWERSLWTSSRRLDHPHHGPRVAVRGAAASAAAAFARRRGGSGLLDPWDRAPTEPRPLHPMRPQIPPRYLPPAAITSASRDSRPTRRGVGAGVHANAEVPVGFLVDAHQEPQAGGAGDLADVLFALGAPACEGIKFDHRYSGGISLGRPPSRLCAGGCRGFSGRGRGEPRVQLQLELMPLPWCRSSASPRLRTSACAAPMLPQSPRPSPSPRSNRRRPRHALALAMSPITQTPWSRHGQRQAILAHRRSGIDLASI